MPIQTRFWLAAGTLLVAVFALPLFAGITGTVHDLSSASTPEVCAFCHTPHFANTNVAGPLWNRYVDLGKVYTLYSSSTMDSIPEHPDAFSPSILCLGCHDGTLGTAIVNTYVGSDKHDLVNAPGSGGIPDATSWPNCRRCHGEMYGDPPAQWLGTDLSNDHPIGMVYPTAAQDPELHVPPSTDQGWFDVPLFSGRVECSSCHAVHDPTITPFLRKPMAGSALCVTCHIK